MKIIIMPDQPQETYGIYGNCVSLKGTPDIMQRSQESLDERFGLEDTENEPGYAGNGSVFPFRDETQD